MTQGKQVIWMQIFPNKESGKIFTQKNWKCIGIVVGYCCNLSAFHGNFKMLLFIPKKTRVRY